MKPEEVRKLIGGYVTGTLTPDERRALVEAALTDQELFDELARDQALKDLLDDPLARERLLGVLREGTTEAPLAVWWQRPLTWSVAGGLAAAAVLVVVFVRQPDVSKRPEPVLMAKREVLPELPSQTAPKVVNEAPVRRKAAAAVPAEQKMTSSEMKAPAAGIAGEARGGQADAVSRPEAAVAGLEAAPRAAKEEEGDRRRLAVGTIAVQRASVPVPYRLLRLDDSGNYLEQPSSAVFGSTDRIRIAFDSLRDGHLRVTAGLNQVLADADVVAGRTFNVDVPPGETRAMIAFTGLGDTSATSIEIQIRRE